MKTMEPLHETENLAMWETLKGLEIHLQGATHAVLVGNPRDAESGKRFMERAERNILNLRRFHNHPA